jgi:hypothetical protein
MTILSRGFTNRGSFVKLASLQAQTRRSAVIETASRVGSVIGLAAHLGRGMQRVVTDLAVGRGGSLPRTIGDLGPAILSQLTGKTVTSVSVTACDAGTSSRARLALIGDGVPESVFVKMPAETAGTRLMGELGRLALYAYVAPLITAGKGGMQDEGIAMEGLRRGVAALEDLDTVAVLKGLL